MSDIKFTGAPTRDDGKVQALLGQKFSAWSRLREARAEMKRLDSHLIAAGASMAELEHMCW